MYSVMVTLGESPVGSIDVNWQFAGHLIDLQAFRGAAWPWLSVITVMVFEPLPKSPVAPSVGSVKITAAPTIGLWFSSSTRTIGSLRGTLADVHALSLAFNHDEIHLPGRRGGLAMQATKPYRKTQLDN